MSIENGYISFMIENSKLYTQFFQWSYKPDLPGKTLKLRYLMLRKYHCVTHDDVIARRRGEYARTRPEYHILLAVSSLVVRSIQIHWPNECNLFEEHHSRQDEKYPQTHIYIRLAMLLLLFVFIWQHFPNNRPSVAHHIRKYLIIIQCTRCSRIVMRQASSSALIHFGAIISSSACTPHTSSSSLAHTSYTLEQHVHEPDEPESITQTQTANGDQRRGYSVATKT